MSPYTVCECVCSNLRGYTAVSLLITVCLFVCLLKVEDVAISSTSSNTASWLKLVGILESYV